MRKPYLARLADLQAAIIHHDHSSSPGELIRSFLAHEAMTSRNLKKAKLLTSELAQLVSRLDHLSLNGSIPYPPFYTLSSINSLADLTFTVTIYNQKICKMIYSQAISLNQEINKDSNF